MMQLSKIINFIGGNFYGMQRCDILGIMFELKVEGLNPVVVGRFREFVEEMLNRHASNIHSVNIVGSALTPDFDEKTSDINSVVTLREMDLDFVRFLAPLGGRYRKKGIAAPLVMTPAYITSSIDVFPIEFSDFRLIHHTVFGDDLFSGLSLDKEHLRLQCEREIKTKLISLRQGYISALGDDKLISEQLARSITGYIPLFRAILILMDKEPPVRKHEVAVKLGELTGLESGIFEKVLSVRRGSLKLSGKDLASVFERYYVATEKISKIVDELRS